jgi:hypothetical protein
MQTIQSRASHGGTGTARPYTAWSLVGERNWFCAAGYVVELRPCLALAGVERGRGLEGQDVSAAMHHEQGTVTLIS